MASPIIRSRDTTPQERRDPAAAGSSSRSNSTFVLISPRAMTTKYYEFWDHTTSTISHQLQNKSMEYTKYRYPFYENVPSSLELLERVLHTKNKNNDNKNTTYNTNTTDQNTESEYEQVDKYIAFICNHGKCDGSRRPRRRRSNNATNNVEQPIPIPKCLKPDTVATRALANRIRTERRTTQHSNVALPILNVGYPKLGSTTLHTYFNCIGIPSDHGQNGPKMNNRTKHQQPLFDSPGAPQKAAYMQLDTTYWDKGIYPQISLLDELHDDYPNATLVLNFRPIQDWLASLSNWHGMRSRLQYMTIPGLILTDAQRHHRHHALRLLQHNTSLRTLRKEMGDVAITNQQLARWVCGHVNHLREYVHWYPSHTLLELDLYDTIGTSRVLFDIFQASPASSLPRPDNTNTNSTSTTTDNTTTTNYNRYKSLTPNNEDVIVNKNTSCWGHTNKGDHKTIRQRRKWRERNNTTSIGTKKDEGEERREQ